LPALVNRDYKDLFAAFNAHSVEFLIVGAYALAVHGHVRATKDLDVWVAPTRENASRVLRALELFGAATENLTESDFANPGTVVQLGVSPSRIDVLTRLGELDFEDAWRNRIEATYGEQRVYVVSREHLISSKKASGRLQDLADIEAIENAESDGDDL
jgi:hypothetical protein